MWRSCCVAAETLRLRDTGQQEKNDLTWLDGLYRSHRQEEKGWQRGLLSQLCQSDLKLNPDQISEASLILSVYLQLTVNQLHSED